MKTGREVFDRAMSLLGYTDKDGNVDRLRDADLYKKALLLVEQIYTDMFFCETPNSEFSALGGLDEEIPLSRRCVNDIMPYGVAMLLAGLAGDASAQSVFSAIYNQKRSAGVKAQSTIADILPTGEW